MAGTLKKLAGPAFFGSAAANIYVPSAATIFGEIRHMHFACVTTTTTVSVYVGATGGSSAGTELFKDLSIATAAVYDYYCLLKLTSTTFLTGICAAAGDNDVTYTIEGYEYVV
jgi:hypothetical protein